MSSLSTRLALLNLFEMTSLTAAVMLNLFIHGTIDFYFVFMNALNFSISWFTQQAQQEILKRVQDNVY